MNTLYYKRLGSGPPILILHGLYGNSDNWISIAKNLSNKFDVIIPDLRNHGRSFKSDEHNYDNMCSDILNLLQELKLNKVFIIGHSMGGKVAMKFAINYINYISGMTIIDIAPSNYDTKSSEFLLHNIIFNSLSQLSLSNLKTREEAFEILFPDIPDSTLLNFLLKNLKRNRHNKFEWAINIDTLQRSLAVLANGFNESDFNNSITGFPIVFLKGDKSNYISNEDKNNVFKLFPIAEIIEVNNAGHWLHHEKPEIVIQAVFDNYLI